MKVRSEDLLGIYKSKFKVQIQNLEAMLAQPFRNPDPKFGFSNQEKIF